MPIYSILLATAIAWLLCLINIGSDVALQDILSMAVSGIYLSYLMVGSLLLYRRCKGDIFQYNDSEGAINVPGAKLVWGPLSRTRGHWHADQCICCRVHDYRCVFQLLASAHLTDCHDDEL